MHSNCGLFTNAMDRIGQSMSDHGVAPVVKRDVSGAAAEGAPNLTRRRPECSNRAYTESRCASSIKIKFSGCADRSGIHFGVRPGDVFAPGRKFKGHFFDPDLHF